MVDWIILTVTTFSGMVAMMVCGYRTLFGHRAVPSKEETSRRIRESTAWLSYIAWIRIDLRATRDLERVAAARVIDLESQLVGAPRPHFLLDRIFSCLFPSKLFSRLFRAAKNGQPAATHRPTSEIIAIKGKLLSGTILHIRTSLLLMGLALVIRMPTRSPHPRPSLHVHAENRAPVELNPRPPKMAVKLQATALHPRTRPPTKPTEVRSGTFSPRHSKPEKLHQPSMLRVL